MAALLLATRNEHKLRELREALPGVEIDPLPDEVELPPERGETFAENALGKARAAHAATGRVAMADDSGPELLGRETIPVFGRESARWIEWSPIHRLHAGGPPFLILVGERDYPGLLPQAEQARDRLTALGERPRYRMLEGNEHLDMVLEPGTKNDRVTAAVVEFVHEVMDKEH